MPFAWPSTHPTWAVAPAARSAPVPCGTPLARCPSALGRDTVTKKRRPPGKPERMTLYGCYGGARNAPSTYLRIIIMVRPFNHWMTLPWCPAHLYVYLSSATRVITVFREYSVATTSETSVTPSTNSTPGHHRRPTSTPLQPHSPLVIRATGKFRSHAPVRSLTCGFTRVSLVAAATPLRHPAVSS
jgi:hypothetical protein